MFTFYNNTSSNLHSIDFATVIDCVSPSGLTVTCSPFIHMLCTSLPLCLPDVTTRGTLTLDFVSALRCAGGTNFRLVSDLLSVYSISTSAGSRGLRVNFFGESVFTIFAHLLPSVESSLSVINRTHIWYLFLSSATRGSKTHII